MNFLETIHERPLVADGAMGTMINSRGIGFERSFEGLNVANPEVILSIHREFVAAGADIIETNTFSATPIHLDRWGAAAKCFDINTAGVQLARQAASEAPRRVFVGGSIGPSGSRLAPIGPLSVDDARSSYREQITALVEAGVDLLVFETFADIGELELSIGVAREVCALPVMASMSFSREVRTTGDVVPEVAIARLRSLNVDVIGANCSTGPRGVYEVLSRYSDSVPEGERVAFAAMPNAGYPESRGERLFFPAPPDYFADYARQFLTVGARVIGGCCGTTPQHIVGVRRALDESASVPVARVRGVSRDRKTDAPFVEAVRREPALAAALRQGKFVTTVEMEPPKSPNTSELEKKALLLRDAGATTLNISDTPMARMRMTGLAAAVRVQQATGIETVLHFPVRGRNLLRVQGDLLAAHALDVRTLFVTMGDLASIGDYPQAFDHHDIVPTGLVKLVKQQFNNGMDSAGSTLGQACSFFVGVAVNLTPTDFEAEAKLLRRKIEFGADYALTQPVFDSVRAHAFVKFFEDNYGPLTLPLLIGILPLASVRHAVFLKNEVPGMSVPDELVHRMDRAGEQGRSEGRSIAADMVAEIRSLAKGVYFIPSFKRYDVVADLIREMQP
jgi:methionine synthase / methylenetetrahydrofolate reductase(NADPH)